MSLHHLLYFELSVDKNLSFDLCIENCPIFKTISQNYLPNLAERTMFIYSGH